MQTALEARIAATVVGGRGPAMQDPQTRTASRGSRHIETATGMGLGNQAAIRVRRLAMTPTRPRPASIMA